VIVARTALKAFAGLLGGYVAMLLVSLATGRVISGVAPPGTVLQGPILALDFVLSQVAVIAGGWVAGRVGRGAGVWLLAVFVLTATVSAPAPNWPAAATWLYAVVSAAVLGWMGWKARERRPGEPVA
jgi:hypothetical protein